VELGGYFGLRVQEKFQSKKDCGIGTLVSVVLRLRFWRCFNPKRLVVVELLFHEKTEPHCPVSILKGLVIGTFFFYWLSLLFLFQSLKGLVVSGTPMLNAVKGSVSIPKGISVWNLNPFVDSLNILLVCFWQIPKRLVVVEQVLAHHGWIPHYQFQS